jgi:hypothetical protein
VSELLENDTALVVCSELLEPMVFKVRLADASPTDGVQDTAATTGGRAGVQQVKLRI